MNFGIAIEVYGKIFLNLGNIILSLLIYTISYL